VKHALVNPLQWKKAIPLIQVTPDGIVTLVSPVQEWKALGPMPVRLAGSLMLVRP
jgi:hypothetical protein